MLYPRDSQTRQLKSLSGIWKFKPDYDECGLEQHWYVKPLEDPILMPVPSSYNDITQDAKLRDHIGSVWYEIEFFRPMGWKEGRIVLRFGSAAHSAIVWVNGKQATKHKGGFLPFEAEITSLLNDSSPNRLTVRLSNILDWNTLPPGEIITYNDSKHPKGYRVQEYHFDFFNYTGIHRPVILYTTPSTYLSDVIVTTDIKENRGIVHYKLELEDAMGLTSSCKVSLLDKKGNVVATENGIQGELQVDKPVLWEPGKGYLYQLKIHLIDSNQNIIDSYVQPIGIRTIELEDNRFLINGKPIYFKGFGKHEDSDLRGRGLDQVTNVKDFNLLKWIGANSFRTSHYPYSEEMMELADQEGILVIDEVPAVGMNIWGGSSLLFTEERIGSVALKNHLRTIQELIQRDKNHPSVVMWSLGNEAATFEEGAVPYFKTIAKETRKMDSSRPITLVQSSMPEADRVAQFFDVICLNRYYSWYSDPGHLELINLQLSEELKGWYQKYHKPVIITEYGADAIAGFHQEPAVMFTEEYQCQLLDEYHKVFDTLDFVIGEHVWNFADFMTKQGTTRIVGNKKGVFTRQRQPKAAAHLLKKRWHKDLKS